MSHTRHVIVIAEAADLDVHRRAGFVGARVVHQQGFEPVGQSDHAVGSIVERGRLELVGNPLDGSSHGGETTSTRAGPGFPGEG